MIRLARVVAVQGIKGDVRVVLDTDFPERLRPPLEVTLKRGEHTLRARLVRFRYRKTGAVLGFAEIADRTEAEAWIGAEVLIPKEGRWPLPEGSLYVDDVLGLKAVDVQGQILGRITAVLPLPAHDVYEIEGGRFLVPAHRAWAAFDMEAGVLRVLKPLEEVRDED